MDLTASFSNAASVGTQNFRKAKVLHAATDASSKASKDAPAKVPTINLDHLSQQRGLQRQASRNHLKDRYSQSSTASSTSNHGISHSNDGYFMSSIPKVSPYIEQAIQLLKLSRKTTPPSLPRNEISHSRAGFKTTAAVVTSTSSHHATPDPTGSMNRHNARTYHSVEDRAGLRDAPHTVHHAVEPPNVISRLTTEETASNQAQYSGNTAMPDFRALIANLRAEGKLQPPPSALDALNNDSDAEINQLESLSDSDEDRRTVISRHSTSRSNQARHDTHDINDMYSTPAPTPISGSSMSRARYDTHDIDDMYASPAPTSDSCSSTPAMQTRRQTDRPMGPATTRYDTHDIDDIYERPAPVSMRATPGFARQSPETAARRPTSSWKGKQKETTATAASADGSASDLVFDWLQVGYNHLQIGERDSWDIALFRMTRNGPESDASVRLANHRKGMARRLGPNALTRKQDTLTR